MKKAPEFLAGAGFPQSGKAWDMSAPVLKNLERLQIAGCDRRSDLGRFLRLLLAVELVVAGYMALENGARDALVARHKLVRQSGA